MLLSCKWTPVRKVVSDKLFNSFGCFVQSLLFALPFFIKLGAFLLFIVSSQCIELSLLATTLNIFFSEGGTQLLTRTEVVQATHGFKHIVAMRTKPNNTKAVNFLLSVCCKEPFNSTFWSCSLEIRHDLFLETAGLVLSKCESTRLETEIPTRITIGRNGLTNRVGI